MNINFVDKNNILVKLEYNNLVKLEYYHSYLFHLLLFWYLLIKQHNKYA